MRRLGLLFALAGCALAVPALAQAAPKIQHPNPLFVGIRLDYISPLHTASGGVATLNTLDPAVTNQAVADLAYLNYERVGDLGGFIPAPVGKGYARGGRQVVGAANSAQIPLYGTYATTKVKSYTFTGALPNGPLPPAQGGAIFVPGLGVPPVVPPPSNANTTPPPNQGFAGRPGTTTVSITTTVAGTTTGTTTSGTPPNTTTTRPRTTTTRPTTTTTTRTTTTTTTTTGTTTAPTTTTTTTTTSPTTTTTPTTTTGGGGGGGGSDCGTIGLSVNSDLNCLFIITNAKPGDSILEKYTIENSGTVPYDLSLQITNDDSPDDHLWDDLTMGIWETPGPAPSPFPPLTDWEPTHITLDHLNPGDSVHIRVECLLPTTAGNVDMNKAAVMTLNWEATG